jgi:hypothetical protein
MVNYPKYLKKRLPNFYKRHYEAHVADGSLRKRKQLARLKISRLLEETSLNRDNSAELDLIADYILTEDHLRGWSLRREAAEVGKIDEEYPPIGEGAQEYHQREYVAGPPITIGERRRVKKCEICRCDFIDKSRRFNAKVCGDTCRDFKDVLRKRAEYNESEHGIHNEKRLKRYRERQDFEYGFYSPYEMYELNNRSERVYSDNKLSRVAAKRSEAQEWVIDGEKIEIGPPRFHGSRKPMWNADDFGELADASYLPKGKDFYNEDDRKSGPITVRYIGRDVTKEQLEEEKFIEADKMKGLLRIKTVPKPKDTSEKYATG